MLSISLSVYFSSDKLAKLTDEICVLFSSSNLPLDCLLQSWHKRDVGVNKVFNCSDLTLLFCRVHLCFIFDLKNQKRM